MNRKQKVQWMRDVVLCNTFKLSEITRGPTEDLVIRGYYDSVEVAVSYQYSSGLSFACVTLRYSGVIYSVIHGELYGKVLVDVFHSIQSGEGRLWRLKGGCLVQCFVEAVREMIGQEDAVANESAS